MPTHRKLLTQRLVRCCVFVLITVGVGLVSASAQIEPSREAFVTNQPGNSVSVVDLDTLKVVADIEVPGKPAGVAVSADRRWIYVTAPEGKALVVIDAAKRAVTHRIAVGEGPLGIATSPTTGLVYVADWYAHKIYEIDAAQKKILRSFAVGRSPSGVAVTLDGKQLLTADRDDNQVSVIDLETGQTSGVVKTGTRPFGITLTPDGKRALTANVKSNDVSVIDIARGEVVATIPVGRRPYSIAIFESTAFVTDQYEATVSVLDLNSYKRVRTIEVDDYPEGIASDPARGMIYVACWEADTFVRIDAKTLSVTGRAEVGQGPRAFGAFLR